MKEFTIELDKPRRIRFTNYSLLRGSREFGVPTVEVMPFLQRGLVENPVGWTKPLAAALWVVCIYDDRDLTVPDMERAVQDFAASRPAPFLSIDLLKIMRTFYAAAAEAFRDDEIVFDGFVARGRGSKKEN